MKWAHPDVIKGGPQEVADHATLYIACSQQPATRDEAVSTYNLAEVSLAPGDFSWSAGASGQEMTVAAKTDVAISVTGDMTHVAVVDDTRLLLVNITQQLRLDVGQLVNLPAWRVLARNPK